MLVNHREKEEVNAIEMIVLMYMTIFAIRFFLIMLYFLLLWSVPLCLLLLHNTRSLICTYICDHQRNLFNKLIFIEMSSTKTEFLLIMLCENFSFRDYRLQTLRFRYDQSDHHQK